MTVGHFVRHPEWSQYTTGCSTYVADLRVPGALTARVLRSPLPHARIQSIDVSRAVQAPGVAAIVTADDLPERRYFHEGPRLADRYPLARDVVRFVGEEVAAVAAESRDQADAALRLIRVAYRRLPAVTEVDSAVRPGAVAIHDRPTGTNVALRIERTYGDPEDADQRTHVEVRGRFRFGRQAHVCMEPNGTVASWNESSGILELWTSTQSPYFVRKEVAHVFGLDMDRVVTHEVAVGGGFGSKSKIADHEVIAAALSMRTGKPVRLVLDREEEFATTKCRHDFIVDLNSGADGDGRLTGRHALIHVDNGAYNHSGASVTGAGVAKLASMYRTGGVSVDARLIDTNKHPGGQFRGYGGPQVLFAIESQVDELADRLEMDPIDLRALNANRAGDVTLAGWRIRSSHLVECLQAVREAIDWDEKRKLGGSGRGVGVAVAMHVTGARTYEDANRAEAGIDVCPDGRVRVRFGGADPGTGQKTVLAQVAAEELGVDVGDVDVVTMESSSGVFDLGAWSSRGTFMAAHAVAKTARAAAATLRERAASKFGVGADDVVLSGGHASAADDSLPLGDLVGLPEDTDGELQVEDAFTVETELVNHETGVADLSPTYSFAAHAAEVEVDRNTGEIRVVDYVAAHDSGMAINPVGVNGQIVGGVVMGLGAALGEELIYEGGRLVNPAYVNYAMPRAADVPPIRPILIQHRDPVGPYGAKGIGEISLEPVPAAIANAVAHAVGVRIRELPLTPDKVLSALRRGVEPSAWRRFRLWRRPGRWWIALMRWAYPRGLHHVLHRWGTKYAHAPKDENLSFVVVPRTVQEASRLLSERVRARPIGGGTDLLMVREQGLVQPTGVVDVTAIRELSRIEETSTGSARIGGAVTLADLLRWSEASGDEVLVQTLRTIASPQIREMATVAGNLVQEKRCWFYRNGFNCYKRGGSSCPCYAVMGDNRFYHAVIGAHRCQAVTPSDLATALVALDAVVHAYGANGRRGVAVAELYSGPGETRLEATELVTDVEIPRSSRTRLSRFEKLRLWHGDFAVASAAVSLALSPAGQIEDVRVVLGAVAPVPIRARRVEDALRDQALTPDVIERASTAWTVEAHPLQANAWKVDAASGLVRRALRSLQGELPDVSPSSAPAQPWS